MTGICYLICLPLLQDVHNAFCRGARLTAAWSCAVMGDGAAGGATPCSGCVYMQGLRNAVSLTQGHGTGKIEEGKGMIVHLNGDFETVDYSQNRSVLLYDNVENEDYPVHWHNAVEIIMPLNNGFEAVCGGKPFAMEERDILIIPAGTLHSLKAQPGRRLIFMCDNAILTGNPALYDLYSVLAEPLLINSGYGKDFLYSLGHIIEEIYTLYSNFGELTEVYIYMKLLSLLAHIKEHRLNKPKYDDGGKYADTFRVVLNYIEKNYMFDITLEDLADIAGYSTYHFSRIFKKYSSTTYINFLNNRRVKAAEILLLEDSISITDVAAQVGFASLTTFNRVFKDIKGCTPSEFKKLYKTSHTTEQLF